MIGIHILIKTFLIVLFLGGIVGYLNYLINVKKVNVWLAPAIIVAATTSMIYLAGLLNIIPIIEYTIITLGVVLLVVFRKDFSVKFVKENGFPLILFMLVLGYIIWYDWGGIYPDGDTMNHWALITKSIYMNNRFPNFLDTIYAQSYPPATACWSYFVLKIIGYTEGRALIAQNVAMACFAATMFSFNKKRTLIGDIMIFTGIFPCLRLLDALTVDVILGTAIIAGFAIFANFYEQSLELFVCLIPFAITITTIKNSGILFALFLSVFLFVIVDRHGSKGDAIKYSLSLTGISAGTLYLWQSHIKMVYPAAEETRHSMSVEYSKSVIGSRDSSYMFDVIKSFFTKWFSINDSHEWLLVLLVILLVSLAAWKTKSLKKVCTVPACFLAFYLVYKVGLLGMYLVNMPGEILHMPAYERYQFTFSIVMIGLIMWFYFECFEDVVSAKIIRMISSVVIMGVCVLIVCMDQSGLFARPDYINGGSHRWLISLINDSTNSLGFGDKILIYHKEPENYIETWAEVTMENEECVGTNEPLRAAEALIRNMWNYDKLVIYSQDEALKKTFEEYGLEDNLSQSVIELEPYDEGRELGNF